MHEAIFVFIKKTVVIRKPPHLCKFQEMKTVYITILIFVVCNTYNRYLKSAKLYHVLLRRRYQLQTLAPTPDVFFLIPLAYIRYAIIRQVAYS